MVPGTPGPMVLLVLLLVVVLLVLGFVLKALFIAVAILLILWGLGWLVHPTGRRWYSW